MSRSKRAANRPPARPPTAKTPPRQPATPGPTLIRPRSKSGDVFGWALPIYMLLLSGGFAFLRSPSATNRGNELSIDRAAFTVINAVTLTGFRQTMGLSELRPPGQLVVFILMTGGTVLTLIIGGELVTKIVGLPFSKRLIYTTAGLAIPIAALLGASGLGDSPLHGAFQGVSALGNSGLFIGRLPAADDLSAILILLPLVIAGGLGLAIWLELYGSILKRKPLSPQSLVSLSICGGVYIIAVGLLLTQLVTDKQLPAALATCSATAITARSAGLPIVSLDQFTRSGQWLLAALMILGPASGGVGGGLKGTTLAVLFRGVRKSYSGDRPGRPFTIAAVWMVAYALLIFIGFLTLLHYAPQMPGDRVLFLVISAASNVGWSHDPISIVKSGLTTLSVIMLAGRILPMAILWWMSKSTAGTDLAVG